MNRYTATALFSLALAGPVGPAVAGDGGGTAAADLSAEGRSIYVRQCSRCHGYNMMNNGLAAFDLRTFPKNDYDRFVAAVTKGKAPKMPPWGDVLSSGEIEALWAYVRTGGTP